MVGLKTADGGILFPAMYDEILDWGNDCDVVYVRKGHEFHYYTHDKEEILTDTPTLPEDAYPEMPYNLGEDQCRNILVCVEPTDESKGSDVCYAYNQMVKLSRILYKDVKNIFANCRVVKMSDDAIFRFEDEDTYIYSARKCKSSAHFPISDCIKQFHTLGVYDSSWFYLIKIDINPQTIINPHDLYNVIKHFEDIEYNLCLSYDIAIDYDESLAVGEVRVLQIHYFSDDMGAFLDDSFKQGVLPNGSVRDVINALDSFTPIQRRRQLIDAYWWITYSEKRNWEETESVLNFLKSASCCNLTMLVDRMTDINYFYFENITDAEWNFRKNTISWALANGAQLNFVTNGMTPYEKVLDSINHAIEYRANVKEAGSPIKKVEAFAHWLQSIGAHSAQEQRSIIETKLEGLSPQEVINLVKTV